MFLFRRFPILGWLLVGWLVIALAQSAGTGAAASIVGFGLLLPLFLMKMMFFLMLAGFVMHKVGGGHWNDRQDRRPGPRRPRSTEEPADERDPEWEKNVRDARDELDQMYPDEPPTIV